MVRKYIKKTSRGSWSKVDMQKALDLCINEKKSCVTTAKLMNIPEPTLRRYIKKKMQEVELPVHGGRFKTTFSNEQLEQLKTYLVDIERRAFGLTKVQCQKLVFEYAESNSIPHNFNRNTKMAGEGWLTKFMKDSRLSLRTPEATSVGRLMCFNRTNVHLFFSTLKEIRLQHSYQAHQIYNVDESGFSTVPTKQPKVISPLGTKRVAKVVTAERGKNVTVVCGLNAVGTYVPPFFIFPRKRMRPEFMFGAPPCSNAIAHESGWMTTDNFLIYLQHFVKYAKPSEDNKILLILDNHASHCSLEAISYCRNNFITMLGFPPHTTHRLQPLDVAVFGPIKTFYSQACENYMISHPGCVISEAQITFLFGEAYIKGATMQNAISGFKSCGIEPYNPNIFQDHDFAASATTEKPLVLEDEVDIGPNQLETQLNFVSHSLNNTASTTDIIENEFHDSPVLTLEETQLHCVRSTNDYASLCQPGPSNMDGIRKTAEFSTTSSQKTQSKLPELPTATRKITRKPRTKLPSMVLTCTPVKNFFEQKLKDKANLVKEKEERKIKRMEKKKNLANKQKCMKIKKGKSIRKKLFVCKSSSSESEEPPYLSTDNDDSDDEECLYCNGPFKNDILGEKWIRCINCGSWAHEMCAGVDNFKQFKCELCP